MKRTRIRSKSAKAGRADAAARSARRRVIEDAEGACQVRGVLTDALRRAERGEMVLTYDYAVEVEKALRRCTFQAQGVHERRKRSSGGSLSTPANLMAACNRCNDLCEDEPRIAHLLGLVVRPGDDEWEALGAQPTKAVRRDIV